MVKTQVQIPDALFREAKRLAEENEMSLAEVVRRGLEEIIRHHPPGRSRADTWRLPKSFDLGEPLAPEREWTALCHDQGTLPRRCDTMASPSLPPPMRRTFRGRAFKKSGIH